MQQQTQQLYHYQNQMEQQIQQQQEILMLLHKEIEYQKLKTYNINNLQIISQVVLDQNIIQATAIEGTPLIATTTQVGQQLKFNFYQLLDYMNGIKQLRIASSNRFSPEEFVESAFFSALYINLRPKQAVLTPCVTKNEFERLCFDKLGKPTCWMLSGLHLHKGGQQIDYVEYNIKIGNGNNIMIEVSKLNTIQTQVKICKILPMICTTDVKNKFYNTFLAISVGGSCFLYSYDTFNLVWQKEIFQGSEYINSVDYSDSVILVSNSNEVKFLTNQSVISSESAINTFIQQLITKISPPLATMQQISLQDCQAQLIGNYFPQYRGGMQQQELIVFGNQKTSEAITSISVQSDSIVFGCTNNQLLVYSKQKLYNQALYNTYISKYKNSLEDIREQLQQNNRQWFDEIVSEIMGDQPQIIDFQEKQEQKGITRSELNNKILQRTMQNQEVSDTVASIEQEIDKNQISLLRNSEINQDISLKTTQEVIQIGQQMVEQYESQQEQQQQEEQKHQQEVQMLQSELMLTKQGLEEQSQMISKLVNENDQLQKQQQKLIDSFPSYQEDYDVQTKIQIFQHPQNKLFEYLMRAYQQYDWFYYFLIQSEKLNIFNYQENINKYIIRIRDYQSLQQYQYDQFQIFMLQIQQLQHIEKVLKSYDNSKTYIVQSVFNEETQFVLQNNQYVDINTQQSFTLDQVCQLLYNKQVYIIYNMNMQYYFEQNSLQWVNSVGKIIRELIQMIQIPQQQEQQQVDIKQIKQVIQNCLNYLQVYTKANSIEDQLQLLETACISNQAKQKSQLEQSMKQSVMKSTIVPTTYKKSKVSDLLQISATCVFAVAILILFTLIIQDSI